MCHDNVCLCALVCPTCLFSLAGVSVCRDRRGYSKYRKTSSPLTSALPLFSRKARKSLISSMACSTLSCTMLQSTSCEEREREGGREEKEKEEKEWGEGETPLVDVKHEGTANEHNWPSFPSSKETAPQSRWSTHKHCVTQCTSVEPPSSSLRPPLLLVSLSSSSRLRLSYRERDTGLKMSSLNSIFSRVNFFVACGRSPSRLYSPYRERDVGSHLTTV